jgi:cytochrome c
VIVAAAAALLPGCSSSDSTPTGGAGAGSAGAPATGTAGAGTAGAGTAGAGTAGAASTDHAGDATNGSSLYHANDPGCYACHGASAEGGIGPNITTSATAGIGAWTQAQFFNAVRNGKARSGAQLCSQMVPFPATDLPDQGIYDIYAYLKTVSSDTVNRGSSASQGCNTQ